MSLEKSLVGRVVLGVNVTDDTVTWKTETGDVVWETEGDCCSHSWIEHAELDLVRGRITSVRHLELPAEWYALHAESKDEVDGEFFAHYGIAIESEQGSGTIDFRNESNGYYGGSMEVRSS